MVSTPRLRLFVSIVTLALAVPLFAQNREKLKDADLNDPANDARVEKTAVPQPLVFRHATMISPLGLKVAGPASSEKVRAFIDPVTGQLTAPTIEESKKLDAGMSSQSATSPRIEVTLPDGTVMRSVGAEAMEQTIATITGEGISFSCVDGDGLNQQAAAGSENN